MNKKILGSCLVALTFTVYVQPAAKSQDVEQTIRTFIDQTLNKQDALGKTPLHYAIETNNTDFAKKVIATAGANVALADNTGITPLHVAAYHGREEIVNLLLSRGVDSNTAAINGDTPLHMAVKGNHFACAHTLVITGKADAFGFKARFEHKDYSAAELAEVLGHEALVKFFIETARLAEAKPEEPSNFSIFYPSTWFSSSAPEATPAADQPAQQ
ncbi:ankyrin repeat domain-containing protein [bacterium]|nr:MAG: ankyrin repeat domain-containing protein [bacterium]